MLLVISAACLCVFTRALLNVCDRLVFTKKDTHFLKSLIMNAIFPFLVSLFVSLFFEDSISYFYSFLLQPGAILSALGAQIAGSIFSLAFAKMPIKNVTVSSKCSDLFIPILIFLLTSKFELKEYIFSCLSVLVFLPILFKAIRHESYFNPILTLSIIAALLFQAGINSFFGLQAFGNTWPKFLALMTSILFWRSIFIVGYYFLISLKDYQTSDEKRSQKVYYTFLFLRSILAFLSQAAFYYSITRVSGDIAWPILNASPLVACLTAHLMLKEAFGKTEKLVLGCFIALFLSFAFFAGE